MKHRLASKLVILPAVPMGVNMTVSRSVKVQPGNGAFVTITVLVITGTPVFALQESNDNQNWQNNLGGSVVPTATGLFTFKTPSISAQYVRLGCVTDDSSAGLIAADIDIADL